MSKNKSEDPRNILPDLIIPTLALVFAIYYLTTITEVPWIAQASAVLVSGLLLISILVYAVRTIMRLRAGTEIISMSGFAADPRLIAKRIALLALTIAYVWLIEVLGFTLCTLAFLFLSIILLSSINNWRRAALVSVCCSLIGYFVFIVGFETRFPKGPFERFMQETLIGS